MKISIIGTGYVGLVAGAVFSNNGLNTCCIDIDAEKIKLLSTGKSPIYEPLLEEQISSGIRKNTLTFSTKYNSIADSEAIFLAVGTPDLPNGSANLSYLYGAIDQVSKLIKKDAILVIKSTVPPNTCKDIKKYLEKLALANEVVMNPEFLRQGSAVNDFLNPDRIVIGCSSLDAKDKMLKVYENWKDIPKVITDTTTAEMIKYAANSFLATKVAFINEMADLCHHFDGDINMLSYALGLDKRIGKGALKAGPGYGGSCFPKDVSALIHVSKNTGNHILKAVHQANSQRPRLMVEKIKKIVGNVKGKKIGVLGLSFKANTDDIRFSPAIKIVSLLKDAIITAFDPAAMDNAKRVLPDIRYATTLCEVAESADCLLILTEWEDFKDIDYNLIFSKMAKPVIIDLRNLVDKHKLRKIGFSYFAL
ncbi:UDP-glucose 6-dehydrogenase [Candidatus Phycorickettsia trachydisci]|uniref:UDP-glucose 6-dehydrogenase n=1 Tax=Candidatus Phycorickettsia trachydisci TaxID=2115978 RepID=A0A2P1PA18_9RICK|nr:UDP-glucose/GDP-mannose dehydrogenase family protein [Candidatus Phycorickettsia trachydisci]AVP88132.1 UDP-glucose 6-dehydrogenase [Candidatus Phycorickettsia trachydisci]